MTAFDSALRVVLANEGGYSNNPSDPGGETNYGICKRDYPNMDIKNLTVEQAGIIYRAQYWDKIKGDSLPYPLALFVFDAAVNQGVDAAIKMLQKAVGVVQDGILGTQTLDAIHHADQKYLSAKFMATRAMRYIGTRNFDQFGTGWMTRLFTTTMGV